MPLSAAEIARHPAALRGVQEQSKALIHIYQTSPRLAAVFATQQRWLLAHVGLALHFRRDPNDRRTDMTMARFIEVVRRNSVASRNTAEAFVKEMLHYNIAEYISASGDGRAHPLRVTAGTIETFTGWIYAHLRTLDRIDGANRLENFLERPEMLPILQPLIADGLLASGAVREPGQTFSLFIWLNNGGIVMDWLMSGIDPEDVHLDRIPTGVISVREFAHWLKLSRTHLARKLYDAEALGSIGWIGQRGHSVMWVSRAFFDEYMAVQAAKLAVVDEAFEACISALKNR
ncbi:hypothetical protein LB515_12235 [Mesorhizobium sp. CA15]|uniref:hypothetical protein n=1 Tax=unclassified Mesorhizobium TaxID=325217 RepID=UPI000BAF312B|nr:MULTISPECIES: hypothetical protein [unclassified Mesorhizobium]MBZ9866150.1 hypothetical protein [Mesorhizobium sp. CA15]PBB20140.1 hypothetical protein CK219_09055 [Mesorhizobium sp. WSM4313]TPI80446.1 hypothetical protein FJ423_12185 [Mesorhizobium sp. B2-8-9]